MTAKRPIYLDNNATTPLDPHVLEEMLPVLKEHFGNPASKTHCYGWYAEELTTIARERIASLIEAQPNEIVFTSGATESNNLVLKGLCALKKSNPHIISCVTEHRSILDSANYLSSQGAQITLLPVNATGDIDPEALRKALRSETVLVSLMLGNNEIGQLHPIAELVQIVRKNSQALFHCDATQALGKMPVSVAALGVDYLSLSAHKIYGPTGVGALFISAKKKHLLTPLLHGGNHENGLRSGTLNVSGIVGLGKAAQIAEQSLKTESKHLHSLTELFLKLLHEGISDITLNGPKENRLPGNLNFAVKGVLSASLIGRVQSRIAFSNSSACSSGLGKPSHVLEAIGLDKDKLSESVRIGIGRFTTEAEIRDAAETLTSAITELKKTASTKTVNKDRVA